VEKRPDSELVALARSGSKDAFGRLVTRYQQMARSVALRLVRDRDLAWEMAQEAILQAYLSLGQLRDDGSFRSWLYSIVRHVCHSHIRTQKAITLSLDGLEEGGTQFDTSLSMHMAPDPLEIAERREVTHRVLDAINALSQKNRAAAQMFYYEQLSLQEIASQLGISISAVKNRLHKSRKRLVAQLSPVYPEVARRILYELRRKTMIQVKVADVIQRHNVAFVSLLDEESHRFLSIQVGLPEALAVSQGLEKEVREVDITAWTHSKYPAPDFISTLLDKTGIELQEVRIEVLKENLLYGVAKVRSGGALREIEARPSDVLALAVRTGAPIYVHEKVLNRAGERIPEELRDTPEKMFPGEKMLRKAWINRTHTRAMERLHARFVALLASAFSEMMGEKVEVAIAYLDLMLYSQFVEQMANPVCACTFGLSETERRAALDIAPPVAAGLLGLSGGKMPELTADRSREMVPIFERILKDLESVWQPIHPVSIGDIQPETDPESIGLTDPDAHVSIVAFEINWSTDTELIWFCYPVPMVLEPPLFYLTERV